MLTAQLSIYCLNKPGVIARIANLLRQRNINIEIFHADTTCMTKQIKGIKTSKVDITAGFKDRRQLEMVVKQLEKLINIVKIIDS